MKVVLLTNRYGKEVEHIVLTEEYLKQNINYYGKALKECEIKIDNYGNKYFTYYDTIGDYYIAVKK